MKLFNVYPLFDIEPVRAEGAFIWGRNGQQYLDLYGGHAVISIGHQHPHYVKKISEQLHQIGFYSNAVQNPLQVELAAKLGELSGYPDYQLFLCNSGAEAIENALKLASFHNDRKEVVVFKKGFHGRTSAAVICTDNPRIQAPINQTGNVLFLELNDSAALEAAMRENEICAVMIEGIQGIGGIHTPQPAFLQKIRSLCDETGAVFIADEIQSGYGRSGKFFAHQHNTNVQPDLITIAKGMGNGFPIGGLLIHPKFEASYGLLGTTFGGNHLACAAGIAVLDVLRDENLIENSREVGEYLIKELMTIGNGIREVRGSGLMIGIELPAPCQEVRKKLLFEHHIFTGTSSDKHTLRILPPLNLGIAEADRFLAAFRSVLVE